MTESRIVTGVGISVSGTFSGPEMAQAVEKAMAQAILDANAEGISTEEKNSVELRKRMNAAREKVMAEWKG